MRAHTVIHDMRIHTSAAIINHNTVLASCSLLWHPVLFLRGAEAQPWHLKISKSNEMGAGSAKMLVLSNNYSFHFGWGNYYDLKQKYCQPSPVGGIHEHQDLHWFFWTALHKACSRRVDPAGNSRCPSACMCYLLPGCWRHAGDHMEILCHEETSEPMWGESQT